MVSEKKSHNANERPALCGICPAGCWVTVTYAELGRIDKVGPDRDPCFGVICKLGEHSSEIVYSNEDIVVKR